MDKVNSFVHIKYHYLILTVVVNGTLPTRFSDFQLGLLISNCDDDYRVVCVPGRFQSPCSTIEKAKIREAAPIDFYKNILPKESGGRSKGGFPMPRVMWTPRIFQVSDWSTSALTAEVYYGDSCSR
jgi:hypothetical protein